MRLVCALAGDLDAFNAALPFLMRALTDDTPDGVFEEYSAGRAQLWLAIDGGDVVKAACVTQSAGDTLHLWLCGGDACDWRSLGDGIAAVARGRFERMTIDGRRGWARVLGFQRGENGVMERML